MTELLFQIMGITVPKINIGILMPIGISFYTLQVIGYLIDVSKGRIVAEGNILKYTLFVSYFPHIVQGPIARYKELSSQLYARHAFHYESFTSGCQLVLWGLLKKVVVADRLNLLVSTIFSDQAGYYQGFLIYIAIIAYTIQIYMDFSGCVDICRGVSEMFGINLRINFTSPYFATSIKEFWGRWHISLSSWLKDYIYIPLGGNRKGIKLKYVFILITFFVSGIWHGAGLKFIVWGCLHAMYQIVGDATVKIRDKIKGILRIEKGSISERVFRIFITFHLVAFAWLFFRAESLSIGLDMMGKMFSSFNPWVFFDGTLYELGIDMKIFHYLILLIVCILAIEEYKFLNQISIRKNVASLHIFLRWFLYFALILTIILLGVYGPGYNAADFIYSQF